MTKTVVVLEEGVKVSGGCETKSAVCSGSQALLDSAMNLSFEGQDVTLLVDGARLQGRSAADLVVCSA